MGQNKSTCSTCPSRFLWQQEGQNKGSWNGHGQGGLLWSLWGWEDRKFIFFVFMTCVCVFVYLWGKGIPTLKTKHALHTHTHTHTHTTHTHTHTHTQHTHTHTHTNSLSLIITQKWKVKTVEYTVVFWYVQWPIRFYSNTHQLEMIEFQVV